MTALALGENFNPRSISYIPPDKFSLGLVLEHIARFSFRRYLMKYTGYGPGSGCRTRAGSPLKPKRLYHCRSMLLLIWDSRPLGMETALTLR